MFAAQIAALDAQFLKQLGRLTSRRFERNDSLINRDCHHDLFRRGAASVEMSGYEPQSIHQGRHRVYRAHCTLLETATVTHRGTPTS
jgi:hypothetical protein